MPRPILSSLLCAAALFVSAPVWAGSAQVDQSGGTYTVVRQVGNKTTIRTRTVSEMQYEQMAVIAANRAAAVAKRPMARRTCAAALSSGNSVGIAQYGDNNFAATAQLGASNAIGVAQAGNSNISYTVQRGSNHEALTTQTGDRNIALVIQLCPVGR